MIAQSPPDIISLSVYGIQCPVSFWSLLIDPFLRAFRGKNLTCPGTRTINEATRRWIYLCMSESFGRSYQLPGAQTIR